MIIAGLAATIIGFSSCCGNSAKCETDSAAKCDSVCEKQPCCQTTPDEIDGIKKALGYYTDRRLKVSIYVCSAQPMTSVRTALSSQRE